MPRALLKTFICFVFTFLFVTSCIIRDTKDFYYVDLLNLNLCLVNTNPLHQRIYLYKTRLNKDKDYIDLLYSSLYDQPSISLHFSVDTPNVVCIEDKDNIVKKAKSGDFHIRVSKIIKANHELSDSTFLKIPCYTIKYDAHINHLVQDFDHSHFKAFFYQKIYPIYREPNGFFVVIPKLN